MNSMSFDGAGEKKSRTGVGRYDLLYNTLVSFSLTTTYIVSQKMNGEGGIRTRGRDKPYTAFPRLLDKPLRHLSGVRPV